MARTLRDSLNAANPNSLGPAFDLLPAGDAFALIPHSFRGDVVSDIMSLPEDRKAVKVLRCYAIGTVSGFFTQVADGSASAPLTTEVKVRPDGDLEFLTADAVTAAYVTYLSANGQVFEETVDVVSDLATLLSGKRAVMLLEVEALAGTVTGVFTPVFAPATPATTEAAIKGDDDSMVEFAAADAVTSARIKYLAMAGQGTGVVASVTTQLETEVDFI